ncbi:hypothetical protein HNR77_005399 [Paenibacillus sp. JGP012]|nr:hypothetical protein [Paenibacillus sp. JGP012]
MEFSMPTSIEMLIWGNDLGAVIKIKRTVKIISRMILYCPFRSFIQLCRLAHVMGQDAFLQPDFK